jgi:hypothetical protein
VLDQPGGFAVQPKGPPDDELLAIYLEHPSLD